MPRADAASRKYEWENSVSRFCQVKNRFVEPHIDEASNIFPKHPTGPQLGNNAAHFRPQVAFIRKALPLSRGGEGLGMEVSVPAAILLSIMSALGACGASGVAGGSLLLIPMACSLFGISNDIAMQVVGVGFIIGVIQDSVETALNSAGDVEFAATAEYHQWLKEGKPLPDFMA